MWASRPLKFHLRSLLARAMDGRAGSVPDGLLQQAAKAGTALLVTLLLPVTATTAPGPDAVALEGLGRPATPAEVAAWDIDVRPDFVGLPPGRGSVAEGEAIWIEQCSTCHGDFGDSNTMFTPLVLGNVTEEDIRSGHVAALNDPTAVRTTLMKVATVSTLWDYTRRAMPWNAPKSLAPEEVYALVAYLLSLAWVVDEDFVLSDENIAEVQARLPNRNGMTTDHGLWSVNGKPDVQASACMHDCDVDTRVHSAIPDYARNAHGNLADQMRSFGPYRGQQTAPEEIAAAAPATTASTMPTGLLDANGCSACHRVDSTFVGPAFAAIAARHRARADAQDYLAGKIRSGSVGVWGTIPMPPTSQLSEADAHDIATWIVTLRDSAQ